MELGHPCNVNLSLWKKSTVIDKLLQKKKKSCYVKMWIIINNTSSYQDLVVYT